MVNFITSHLLIYVSRRKKLLKSKFTAVNMSRWWALSYSLTATCRFLSHSNDVIKNIKSSGSKSFQYFMTTFSDLQSSWAKIDYGCGYQLVPYYTYIQRNWIMHLCATDVMLKFHTSAKEITGATQISVIIWEYESLNWWHHMLRIYDLAYTPRNYNCKYVNVNFSAILRGLIIKNFIIGL